MTAPPLRERPEEIPWLVHAEVARAAPGLALHVSLVEACLCRVWPGNVRELLAETRSAAQAALATGAARVEALHLSPTAGSAFAASGATPPRPLLAPGASSTPPPPPPTRAKIAGALKRFAGNVSAAARNLGVHRTQLRRWMDRHGLDARTFGPPTEGDDD